jgi:uncharacterized protein (UPF0303 family)
VEWSGFTGCKEYWLRMVKGDPRIAEGSVIVVSQRDWTVAIWWIKVQMLQDEEDHNNLIEILNRYLQLILWK